MNNIHLVRGPKSEDGIFGTMYGDDDSIIAATLEHAFLDGNTWTAKIAPGTYKCVRYNSPDHGYVVFVLENVPPFMGKKVTFCEIHIGNFNKDSDGCILLGSVRNGDMILDSKITFDKFMDMQKDVESFVLTITEES